MPSGQYGKLVLECRTAICVIDREEGGADALARLGVRLFPLFRAAEIVAGGRIRKAAWLSGNRASIRYASRCPTSPEEES